MFKGICTQQEVFEYQKPYALRSMIKENELKCQIYSKQTAGVDFELLCYW